MRLDSEEAKNAVKSMDTAVRKIAVDTLFESGMVNEEVMHELMSDPASAVRSVVAKNISDRNLDESIKGAYNRYVDVRMGVEDASEAITESPILAVRLTWCSNTGQYKPEGRYFVDQRFPKLVMDGGWLGG